ncbi:XRE family transcriptional regulator [Streptomyces sp. J2-1]|uniref:XRE family transcriptional regulator n=1 Tax=Streptomyces corallincola TaxID=2851888 RepID=UPI001C3897A9|nr:XRE family transcriptional regulator [Streptomyces corallincola]MBV2356225.1 XRE family transcriptional regulator [Streptomyces corallincola]
MRHPQESSTPDERLAVRLRELRAATGLSLAALAARTPYSKSAWHRCLSGGRRPPKDVLVALCRLAGADPAPVLELWEAAGRAPEPADARPAARPEHPHRARWLRLSALALLTTAVVVVAVTAAVSDRHHAPSPAARTLPATASRCHAHVCQGDLPDLSVCARDARTESRVTDFAYDVRLRYSPACGTAWAQVRVRSRLARVVSVRSGQDVLSAGYPAGDATGNSSPMLSVPSPNGVAACAEVGGQLACTGLKATPADG